MKDMCRNGWLVCRFMERKYASDYCSRFDLYLRREGVRLKECVKAAIDVVDRSGVPLTENRRK